MKSASNYDNFIANFGNYPCVPQVTLQAYDVAVSTPRTLTRNSSKDITYDYILSDSIRYEQTIGDDFTPGNVIPSIFSCNVRSDCPNIGTVVATPLAASVDDYSTVYRIYLTYKCVRPDGTGYYYYYLGGTYVCTAKSQQRSLNYKIELKDEMFVFDNAVFNLANYTATSQRTYGFQDIVKLMFRNMNFSVLAYTGDYSGLITNLAYVISGTNYYTGQNMSTRTVLSHICEMNGLNMIESDSKFIFKKLDDGETRRTTIPDNMYHNYSFGDYSGKWNSAIINPSDDPIRYSIGNFPDTYFVQDNPLVSEGNKSTYSSQLNTNMKTSHERKGFHLSAMFIPQIEAGDLIKSSYYLDAHTIASKDFIVSRIQWNGGGFADYEEAEFNPIRRNHE